MGLRSRVGKSVAPRLQQAAPELTTGFVLEALDLAIRGTGPLPGAEAAAARLMTRNHGNVERTIHDLIEQHVRYAGAQGFVTNLGGLTTAAVAIPANIAGLALIQCRLVAAIAHLRGHDIHDPRVRNAILATTLGEETVELLVRRKKLAATPLALATAPAHDPATEKRVAAEVSSELIARVAGKRAAGTITKRVPVVGGLVGLSADGFATWRIGRYADRELLPRTRR